MRILGRVALKIERSTVKYHIDPWLINHTGLPDSPKSIRYGNINAYPHGIPILTHKEILQSAGCIYIEVREVRGAPLNVVLPLAFSILLLKKYVIFGTLSPFKPGNQQTG